MPVISAADKIMSFSVNSVTVIKCTLIDSYISLNLVFLNTNNAFELLKALKEDEMYDFVAL